MTPDDDGAAQLMPRQVAFDVVREVTGHDAYANLVLPKRLRASGVTGRDAAFATEVTYGTLRRLHTYDALVERSADRPPAEIDAAVLDLLRIGVHQLFFMSVAPHAAVATTVELAKRNRLHRAAGFINAVLRRVTRSSWEQWMAELTYGLAPGSDADLALRLSHPHWLVRELRRALVADGRPEAEIGDLLTADNDPAPVTLVARPPGSTVTELVAAGAVPGRWSPFAAVLGGGDPGAIPAVRERRAGVQDQGSQLVTLALAGVPLRRERDEQWLDMCAGPGGKAALLASLAARDGAQLEAWELHEHRAELVRRQVPSTTRVLVADSADPAVVARAEGGFDRVLLDAPCSGAGALRRRPEARWRKSAADLPHLVDEQARLLSAALTVVRPGGVVAYVTCSPIVDETRGVLESVLGDGIEVLDARGFMPAELAPLGPGPYVQLWPHLHETDAMFLALLRRSGD
jgi:16S rRNA (cytosine967-C5)-methyltransferase